MVLPKLKRHLNAENTLSDHDSIHGHRNLNDTERSAIARHRNFNAPKICKITVSKQSQSWTQTSTSTHWDRVCRWHSDSKCSLDDIHSCVILFQPHQLQEDQHCVCVCVCVSQWKESARRMASMTSDTSSSSKHNAKESTTRTRGPFCVCVWCKARRVMCIVHFHDPFLSPLLFSNVWEGWLQWGKSGKTAPYARSHLRPWPLRLGTQQRGEKCPKHIAIIAPGCWSEAGYRWWQSTELVTGNNHCQLCPAG